MKEYTLFRRIGQACPYNLFVRNNIFSVLQDLNLMISYDEERGKEYYVDNEFFENKYIFNPNSIYYCIKVRNVTKWEKYSELTETNENNIINSNSKIVDIFDYKIKK